MEFERKQKEFLPVVAVCYDFDNTLSPDDMQAQGFIQRIGFEPEDFWKYSSSLSFKHNMDRNSAYMLAMIQKSEGKFKITRELLKECGKDIRLFPGVKEWFPRINAYAEERGVILEHYIISCGLKEILEGTPIANEFTEMFACAFAYDDEGVAMWPAQVVNYTSKTQYLFRITKGMLDILDEGVNGHMNDSDKRISFRNMVYIGDSLTDIPCMKVVSQNGGTSVGVYNPSYTDDILKELLEHGRINCKTKADYREGKALDILVKSVIDKASVNPFCI